MATRYLMLESVEQVKGVLNSSAWSAYARFTDRQDSPIYDLSAVRESDGELWVNAGEWHHAKGYLNEEWIKPVFVFMRHQCDGCSYPPDMCCLAPAPRYRYDSFYEVDEYDDDYDDGIDDQEAGYAALAEWPVGVTPRVVEL